MIEDGTAKSTAADPRVYFATERTLLAWVRTGLAMMGFGFVVARFGMFLREMALVRPAPERTDVGRSLWLGSALVVLGALVSLAATASHWRTVGRLNRGQSLQFSPLSLAAVVAMTLGVLGLCVTAYLLLGLNEAS